MSVIGTRNIVPRKCNNGMVYVPDDRAEAYKQQLLEQFERLKYSRPYAIERMFKNINITEPAMFRFGTCIGLIDAIEDKEEKLKQIDCLLGYLNRWNDSKSDRPCFYTLDDDGTPYSFYWVVYFGIPEERWEDNQRGWYCEPSGSGLNQWAKEDTIDGVKYRYSLAMQGGLIYHKDSHKWWGSHT